MSDGSCLTVFHANAFSAKSVLTTSVLLWYYYSEYIDISDEVLKTNRVFPKTPTLDDIRPYIDDVLKNGSWKKVDDARGEGKKIIGEIFQAEHNGVWIRGFKDINTGRIIVNNAGAL